MKKYFLAFSLSISSLFCYSQMDTCTNVSDTLLISHLHPQTLSCPAYFIWVDTSLIHIVDGVKTYLIVYDAANPNGCVNEYQLGTLNFGDTIPITYTKHEFGFLSSTCGITSCYAAIVEIGRPTTVGQTYYCHNDIHLYSSYVIDGCTSVSTTYIDHLAIKNCSVVDYFPVDIPSYSSDLNTSIYPNPVRDILYIKPFNDKELFYDLYTITGVKLYSEKLINEQINFKLLPNGVYFLHLRNKMNKPVLSKVIQKIE